MAATLDSDPESLKGALTENFTQCSICKEDYKYPKMLPCLHSFCHHCLVRHVEAKSNPESEKMLFSSTRQFSCPFCQESTVIPPGGISSLRSNAFIQNIQETVGFICVKDKKCDICQENATSFCLNCKDSLCQDCASGHSKFTHDHKVINIANQSDEDIQEKIRSSQDVFCPAHKGKVVEYFCKPCQTPICCDCTVLDHHGHECQSLQEAAENFKKTLPPRLQKLEENVSHFIQCKTANLKQRDSLNEMKLATNKSIVDWASELVTQIRQREAELLEESKAAFDVQVKKVQASRDNIELKMGILQSIINLGNRLVEQGRDAEILFLHGEVTDKIGHLQSAELGEPPSLEVEAPATLETDLVDLTSAKLIIRQLIPKFVDPPQLLDTIDACIKHVSVCLQGVAVLYNGDIVIADSSSNNKLVQLYDSLTGKTKWGAQYGDPYDVVVTKDNDIMVSVKNSPQIYVLNIMGQVIRTFNTGIKCSSPGLAILNMNRIIITDSDKKCFHICNFNGTVTKTVHHKSFQCPHYVACSLNGNIIISDSSSHIVVFDQEGNHITTYGTPGSSIWQEPAGPLFLPRGVCTDSYNNIIVADEGHYSSEGINVVLLDSEGNFVRNILTKSDLGDKKPYAVTATPDDCLIVTTSDGLVRKVKYLTISE